jgi:chromosome segregation ATPase
VADDAVMEALRADVDRIIERITTLEQTGVARESVRRLETLFTEQRSSIERQLKAGLEGIDARFNGLESEMRYLNGDIRESVDNLRNDMNRRFDTLDEVLRVLRQMLNGRAPT